VSDDAPDTVRDGRGPKWWSRDHHRSERGPKQRPKCLYPKEHAQTPSFAVRFWTCGCRRRAQREQKFAILVGEEREALNAFADAIRDLLGLEPLYTVRKGKWARATGRGMDVYDPHEGNRRVHGGNGREW
jgi:hypothetical protein